MREDEIAPVEVVQRAALILDRCDRVMNDENGYGGTVSVGPLGGFQVSIGNQKDMPW